MRHKKSGDVSDEGSALEQRVDRMMDPHQPDEPALQTSGEADQTDSAVPPPIDIFKDSVGAPSVPPDVLQEMGLKDDDNADGQPNEGAKTEKESEKAAKAELPEEPLNTEATEPFSDKKTDEAVTDIEVKDSDKVLEAEDAELAAAFTSPQKKSFGQKVKHALKKWWVWLIIMLVILGVLYAVPFTRFNIAAQFVKRPFTITVVDSVTHTPVSGATVTLNGTKSTSDAKGKASFDVPVGHEALNVKENYYKGYSSDVLVPLWSSGSQTVQLVATGRRVPVKVVNKLTGQPVSGAEVRVLDTKATTGKDGTAIIVLPTGKPAQAGKVQAAGYNAASVSVQVTGKAVQANTFEVTPAGRIYYLSTANGVVNVASANLDGTGQTIVLAGTSSGNAITTTMQPSSDGRYVMLKAARSGPAPELFLIDTAKNNKLTTVDNSDADFYPIGWIGHDFIYRVTRSGVPVWQSGGFSIESYNADSGKTVVLVNTKASGTSDADAEYQNITTAAIIGGKVAYGTIWYQASGTEGVSGQQNVLTIVNPDGSDSVAVKKLDSTKSYFDVFKYLPQEAVVEISAVGGNSSTFYVLKDDGTLSPTTDSSITAVAAGQSPSYLPSPNGTKTLWSEDQGNGTILMTGDIGGHKAKTLVTLGAGYSAYGWYTNNYVLILGPGNNLYILPTAGLVHGSQPVLVAGVFS